MTTAALIAACGFSLACVCYGARQVVIALIERRRMRVELYRLNFIEDKKDV